MGGHQQPVEQRQWIEAGILALGELEKRDRPDEHGSNLGTRVVRITLDHRVPGRVPDQTGWMADEELTRIAARLAGYGAIAKKWDQYSVRISDRIALAEFGVSDEELSFASDVLIEKTKSVSTDGQGAYQIVDLRPGVSFVARPGWRGEWHVREAVRKIEPTKSWPKRLLSTLICRSSSAKRSCATRSTRSLLR